ncbi:hypothetical protein NA57DRAFT_56585 [Rhizodiscina lignyota]|uniref:Methyltransferase domain-containing protein n=1 Tax=Rhizodiscina lignyota TaxID=1504668 RepID=A0A9P4M931_9PEZI|nr:hypothetical protein NA57DRAFT_56585 [Rhizodiscina lignyota]
MKSKHTLPNVVTEPWKQDAASDPSTRRTTGNLDSWSVNATFWDKVVGEGNDMYQELVLPVVEELAEITPGSGECMIDLATGNGIVARKMRACMGDAGGGRVFSSDGCKELLDLARERERMALTLEGQEVGKLQPPGIEYIELDLMDEGKMDEFAEEYAGAFDVITLIMAILELPSLEPLARLLPRILKPGTGRFIAVNLHPAFSKPAAHRVIEVLENPNTGQQETRHWIKSSAYLSIPPCSSQGIRDQPAAQTLFHRPLQDVFMPFFATGKLTLDGFKELAFQHEPDRAQIQSYHNFPQFPMLIAFRLRVINT